MPKTLIKLLESEQTRFIVDMQLDDVGQTFLERAIAPFTTDDGKRVWVSRSAIAYLEQLGD